MFIDSWMTRNLKLMMHIHVWLICFDSTGDTHLCYRIRKGFKCHCGKSYKTCHGLRNHTAAHHSGANLTTLTTQNGEVLQIPTSHVAALQPIRAIALKQISTASLGAAISLPVKTIQGLVVATKPNENGNITQGETGTENNFDAVTFAKSSTIHVAVPALAPPPTKGNTVAGLVVNGTSSIPQAAATEQQTVTTALGVLTPATSPQTPVPESTKSTATLLTPTTPVSVPISPSALPVMPVTSTTGVGIQLEFAAGPIVSSSSPTVGTQTLTPNNLVSNGEAAVVTQASSL